jgi:small subunit ribosomal protein S27Ae
MAPPAKPAPKPSSGGKKGGSKGMRRARIYTVSGDTVTRKTKSCPKCGPGIFMGLHSNRTSCGKCGYTEFKSKSDVAAQTVKKK